LVFPVHRERDALPQALVRPDLVVEREVGSDVLGEDRRLVDLTLERCSYLTVWWKRSTTGSAPGA